MAQAKTGDTVKVFYTGKLDQGMIFESNENREPLVFVLGSGAMIEGFEEAIVGMSPGEKKTVTILVEKAYGLWTDTKVFDISRESIPSDIDLEIGKMLEICEDDGRVIEVQVTEITPEKVTLDANHPMADRDVIFDITLVEIMANTGANTS